MYVASTIGLQDDYDTQIIKDVWNNSMSNMNDVESSSSCEAVYESQGSSAYNKCYQASLSCGSDSKCDILAKKYAQALVGGYSKDFESFKNKSNILSSAGEIAGSLLSGLLGKNENDTQIGGGGYYAPQSKSNKGLYIGIGVVALIGIGTATYFALKKK